MKKRKKYGRRGEPLALRPEAFGFLFAMPTAQETVLIDGIAVICIDGPLEHKAGYWWDSYECIAQRFSEAIYNPDVRAVLLKIDSPGGDVAGLIETVRDLKSLKVDAGKPVYAYADEGAYSAGYALACIADEIYLPDTGGVGSIGVITALTDVTKLNADVGIRVEVISSGDKKTDGHPDVPITDDAITRTRDRVDQLAELFFETVSASRGIDVGAVRDMQAGLLFGQGAVAAGLADGVMGLSAMIEAIKSVFDGGETGNVNQGSQARVQSAEQETDMRGLLAAKKALSEAQAALAKAKTTEATSKAAKAIADAEGAIKAIEAGKVTEKKTTKTENDDGSTSTTKETHTYEESTTPADGEEPSGESSEAPADDDKEDDEDAKAIAAVARKLTGKATRGEVIGALYSMSEHADEGREAVAELHTFRNGPSVEAMVDEAIAGGKLAKAKREKAVALGNEAGKSALKTYLEDRSPIVATVRDGGLRPPQNEERGGAPVSQADREVAARMGVNIESLAAHRAKRAQ